MQQGTVKFYNDQKGFGFIIPDAGGDEIFFHVSNCSVGYLPQQNDVVTYEQGQGRDERPVAVEVAPTGAHAAPADEDME